jgi:hypothetical protein
MFRVCLTIVLPLLLPSGLYLAWIWLIGVPRGDGGAVSWTTIPWVWLAAAGALLLAIVLFVVTVGFGTTTQGIYVAPQWLNGRIVPGHFIPGHDASPAQR